jgi:hypothetical protein
MTQIKKTSPALRNIVAGILGTVGSLGLLGSAGTEDARDAMEYENYTVGYEKHDTDELASPKTTKTMAWVSIAALAGCVALLSKKENQR